MRRVDLSKVASRAMRDRDFFEALREDPEAALQQVGWSLDQEDMETLTAALEGDLVSIDFNAVEFIEEQLDQNPDCGKGWVNPA